MQCQWCNIETSNPKFCSRSCAAKFNNISGKYKRRAPEGNCRTCKKQISTRTTWCKECIEQYHGSPPRKSRTFPSNLEDSSLVPLAGGKCSCGKSIGSKSTMCRSCSAVTAHSIKATEKITNWLSGSWRGGTDHRLSDTVRNYLLEAAEYSCSKCGFNTMHPDDGHTILEINHINGDGLDHRPNNLEVLCPNCHALTSTYRGRNIGSGRPVYYLRRNSI